MKKLISELAPCGVFCGSCPSFNKSCFGCSSENVKQAKRKSCEGCKIRVCCYTKKQISYCAECDQFPCSIIKNKLINSHPDDPRYKYRHEIEDIAIIFKEMNIDDYLRYQNERWKCPGCGAVVHFYHYKCGQCGKKVDV